MKPMVGLQLALQKQKHGRRQAERILIHQRKSDGCVLHNTHKEIVAITISIKENKNMKAMLTQPMAGKTDEEIVATRNRAINAMETMGYTVVNTFFTDEWYSKEKMKERGVVQIPICFLAKSLENMSLCDAVYFVKGWESARGCKIEHMVAEAYGVKIL
jgi:hypothetical protein